MMMKGQSVCIHLKYHVKSIITKASGGIMPVHIFVMTETNYEVCVRKGLTAVPSKIDKPNVNDGLISRMSLIRKGDLILFYLVGIKEIHGVFKALERPFYDDTFVWEPNPKDKDAHQVYPYRVRFDNSDFNFKKPVNLSDIYDLKDNGLIWTFTLNRPNGTGNSLFAITETEYKEILNIFLKINAMYSEPQQIREPYRYFKPGLYPHLTFDDNSQPKYESTLMSLLLDGFATNQYENIFGKYSDYVAYVPTSFNKEIDILLLHSSPIAPYQITAYNIIEVKNAIFDEKGLSQLLKYEDWFLKKRVNGDYNMIRTTAIAPSFSKKVKEYISQRREYEGKEVLLLKFLNTYNGLELIREEF